MSTVETSRALPRPLSTIFSGARFALAAGIACGASAVFYAGTCLALYLLLLAISAVTNTDPGGPLAGIFWPIVLFFVGLVIALIVYTPITLLAMLLARRRMWIWLLAPVLMTVLPFTVGMLRGAAVEPAPPLDLWTERIALALVLPYFFAGGYCLYWLVVFVPCQLGPWVLGRLQKG